MKNEQFKRNVENKEKCYIIGQGEKGITLVALVVTIIVLLILAGIAISLSLGNNGLFSRSRNAANTWKKAEANEQEEMKNFEGLYDNVVNNLEIPNGNDDGGNEEEKTTFGPTTTEANSSVTIATSYGKIDVIWLDTNNKVIEKPNNPANNLGGMTPVKWDGVSESETTTSDINWYNYTSIEGDGDNTTSHWANAKNNGSYFVWIPRYAYRITYYDENDLTQPTGYYDGCGMWKSTGELKLNLDEGIETVVNDGKSYIVHPAFMKDDTKGYAHGGWSSNLAGIWVAKYEMSMETNGSPTTTGNGGTGNKLTTDTIKAVSKPSVSSWRYITIGNMYTNSYNYDRDKESHLLKNSEWGAIVYLTHSQYGRNGHEIDINNSSSFITGNGGGSTSANKAPNTTNVYNSEKGQKASSTGNIYGIYDLSGGAWERVAAFNDADTNNYETTYGSSFASLTNESTKYATKYNNNTATNYGDKIYEVGKTGDAMKEVYKASNGNWFNGYSNFLDERYPFFARGGSYDTTSDAGIFYSYYSNGNDSINNTFRVVLAL